MLAAAGESTVVTVKTEGGDKDTLIHAIEYHPVSGEPLHADFYIIEKNKPVQVHVPLEFEGEAPAVKQLGGNLVKVLHEIEIEALPKDLPQEIKVDISSLATLDSQLTVADIKLPAGVTAITDLLEVVASISTAGEEVVEEAPVDLSSIEVEKKGKQEEGEEAPLRAPPPGLDGTGAVDGIGPVRLNRHRRARHAPPLEGLAP